MYKYFGFEGGSSIGIEIFVYNKGCKELNMDKFLSIYKMDFVPETNICIWLKYQKFMEHFNIQTKTFWIFVSKTNPMSGNII